MDNGDGTFTRILEGGWHYSTRINEHGHEVPHLKLHLCDVGLEKDWFYEYAEDHHRSWVEKHGVGQPVALGPLPPGVEHPPEAHSDHPSHAQYRRYHLGEGV